MSIISHTAAASFTRPSDTTAYADGDLVANSTTAGLVVPLRFPIPRGNGPSICIRGASVTKSDGADVTGALFSVHLFAASPTPVNGDNGALVTNIAQKIGLISIGQTIICSDDAYGIVHNAALYHRMQDSVLYGLLEADGAYTPASAEVFTVALIVEHLGA